jgi:hypothetical protein
VEIFVGIEKRYKKVSGYTEAEIQEIKAEADYKYYESLGRKKNEKALYILVPAISALLASAFLVFSPGNIEIPYTLGALANAIFNTKLIFAGIAVALVAYFVSVFFSYLKPEMLSYSDKGGKHDFSVEVLLSGYERKLASVEKKFDSIIEKLQSGSISGEIFSKDEKGEILNDLRNKLEANTFEEYLSRLTATIKEGHKFKQREDIFIRTISRLELEIQNQSKRGNVNLLLGIFTTVFGVVILGYSVLQAPLFTSGVEIAAHFLPRISLVIVVEVFAYFFLKLYKQSLDEIKYFQNEMTNIESKYLGLYIATESELEEGVLDSINQLSSTERNFFLDKGQSTAIIELKKIEATSNGIAMEKLSSIISDLVKIK